MRLLTKQLQVRDTRHRSAQIATTLTYCLAVVVVVNAFRLKVLPWPVWILFALLLGRHVSDQITCDLFDFLQVGHVLCFVLHALQATTIKLITFFGFLFDISYLDIVRHLEEDVALGVHVFHCVATVLWIRHVHVLGSNFKVFPVLNKNHFDF